MYIKHTVNIQLYFFFHFSLFHRAFCITKFYLVQIKLCDSVVLLTVTVAQFWVIVKKTQPFTLCWWHSDERECSKNGDETAR